MDIDIHALHSRTPIADGHADSLMWNRDLTQIGTSGQVDFPRLQQAGVKIQCFTIVTRGFPFVNGFPLFALYRRWPAWARKSEWTRTLFQIEKMEEYCRLSGGTAAMVHSARDLELNLKENRLSIILGIEGAHAIEGRLERVAELYRRGVRFMSLTHLSNNELGGSSSPLMGNRPLTSFGRHVLDEMIRVGMAVDVAHASKKTLENLLEYRDATLFCSHGGAFGAHRSFRNLSDSFLREMANRGGVLGVIFATIYLGGRQLNDVAAHIEHAIKVMGEENVGLGSDFDGMVPLPKGMRDVRDLHRLTETLVRRGHSETRVERVLGRNFRRFWHRWLG